MCLRGSFFTFSGRFSWQLRRGLVLAGGGARGPVLAWPGGPSLRRGYRPRVSAAALSGAAAPRRAVKPLFWPIDAVEAEAQAVSREPCGQRY